MPGQITLNSDVLNRARAIARDRVVGVNLLVEAAITQFCDRLEASDPLSSARSGFTGEPWTIVPSSEHADPTTCVTVWHDSDWDRWSLPVRSGADERTNFEDGRVVMRVNAHDARVVADISAAYDLAVEFAKRALDGSQCRAADPCGTLGTYDIGQPDEHPDDLCIDCGWDREDHPVPFVVALRQAMNKKEDT